MERKHLKKEIKKLLADYVGTRLRENEFDPKGRKKANFLDEMAHYDLAIGVALLWLNDSESQTPPENEKTKLQFLNNYKYPNKMEREAMILSSFAGILMNSIPVEDVLGIYSGKTTAQQQQSSAKGPRTQPFNLSMHPYAMLTAPQAAKYTWDQNIRFQKTASSKNTTGLSTTAAASGKESEGTPSSSDNWTTDQITEEELNENVAEVPETREEASEKAT